MLNYNEIKPGVAVIVEGEPYVCTWNNIMQKQQRRPVNQTKLRHLIRGNSIEYSFQQSDKLNEAPPDVRGNPAQGGSKIVTLETGATMNVPMFIKEGDVLRINTETGEYVERA